MTAGCDDRKTVVETPFTTRGTAPVVSLSRSPEVARRADGALMVTVTGTVRPRSSGPTVASVALAREDTGLTTRVPLAVGPLLGCPSDCRFEVKGVVGPADANTVYRARLEAQQGSSLEGVAQVNLTTPTEVNVAIVGMEIYQSTQYADCGSCSPPARGAKRDLWYTGVPLAGPNKETFVRVWVHTIGSRGPGAPPGLLSLVARDASGAFLPGTEFPRYSPAGGPKPGPAYVTSAERRDPRSAYIFRLPPGPRGWTTATGLSLTAFMFVGEGEKVNECYRCADDNDLTVSRISVKPVYEAEIVPVQLRTRDLVPSSSPETALATPRALLPTQLNATGYEGVLDLDDVYGAAESRRDRASAIAAKLAAWAGKRRYRGGLSGTAVGVMHDDLDSGAQWRPAQGGDPGVAIIRDSDRPVNSSSHELGHLLGLKHAGDDLGCYSADDIERKQVGVPWPPDHRGYLQGVGFDTRTFPPTIVTAASAPALDFMSYCLKREGIDEDQMWISPRNWAYLVASQTRIETAGRRATPRQVGPGAPGLAVYGTLRPDGTAVLHDVVPRGAAPTPSVDGERIRIVVRSDDGRILHDVGVTPGPPDEDGYEALRAQVPAEGVARIEVHRDGALLTARSRSAHDPVVRVLAPRAGAVVPGTGQVAVTWSATDADGDVLEAQVDYAAGSTWRPIYLGPARTGRALVPARLLTASRRARIRIRVSDGFRETTVTTRPFIARGAPPRVRIVDAPRETRADRSLQLSGVAGQAGEQISGRRLRWYDGARFLGSGTLITVRGLRPGVHALRLVAQDSSGRRATARHRVRVAAVTPRLLRFVAPSVVRPTARRVSLRVASNVPATLRIGNVRVRTTDRLRRVDVAIAPGRTALTLRLRLSAGGRTATQVVRLARG